MVKDLVVLKFKNIPSICVYTLKHTPTPLPDHLFPYSHFSPHLPFVFLLSLLFLWTLTLQTHSAFGLSFQKAPLPYEDDDRDLSGERRTDGDMSRNSSLLPYAKFEGRR
ncbi:unnamed protein product [Cuscuta europaea]|uniref:Uncharacterized protein n=1 Tax=Cuscuta europaea TaxID=41803 RepID=A0A9P0YWH0_CUSEU|nr:unnamed protein product [Cuscuta europaea]